MQSLQLLNFITASSPLSLDLPEAKRHKTAGGGTKDGMQGDSEGALGVSVAGKGTQRRVVRECGAEGGAHKVLGGGKVKMKQKYQQTKRLLKVKQLTNWCGGWGVVCVCICACTHIHTHTVCTHICSATVCVCACVRACVSLFETPNYRVLPV